MNGARLDALFDAEEQALQAERSQRARDARV
jgi:hypothetical protein